MPFYKKSYNKQQGVYYPRAVVQGKPVETETIAKDLAKISTVSNSDVQAVLGDIAGVMHTRMAQGKSVHIKGLGYFRYTLDTVGVDSLEAFDFEKQVKAVRVEFIPERTKLANGTYTRALVDSDQLEWIELSPETKDSDPAQDDDDDEGVTEDPLA
ncbi:DNA-binding protein [Phocaeicola barnesiae]|uniref:HU family DNA-binding protein n=1 Tax=Phocaeicola barnesiae TaxID=376804 RepID=UPI0025A3FB3D|nr:HU family DNA-binding protein [Phocaeicola barnesiae]MDM8251126.1 DNA-binding protein [Phocaeicola barnesiae]